VNNVVTVLAYGGARVIQPPCPWSPSPFSPLSRSPGVPPLSPTPPDPAPPPPQILHGRRSWSSDALHPGGNGKDAPAHSLNLLRSPPRSSFARFSTRLPQLSSPTRLFCSSALPFLSTARAWSSCSLRPLPHRGASPPAAWLCPSDSPSRIRAQLHQARSKGASWGWKRR
jgi:hypothetical protein